MLVIYLIVAVICAGLIWYLKRNISHNKKCPFKVTYSKAVADDIQRIRSEPDTEKLIASYYNKKIKSFLILVLAGCLLAAFMEVRNLNEHELIEGRFLAREGYDGSGRRVALWARNAVSGEKEKIFVEVREKRYPKATLDLMLEEIEGKVPAMLLCDNLSADHVERKLDFPQKLEGYPFSISYSTDNPMILSAQGIVNEETLAQRKDASEGIVVKVVMKLTYEEYSGEIYFYVRVYPQSGSKEETFFDSLRAAIDQYSEASREKDLLELPTELFSAGVTYEEPISYESLLIFILGIVIAFLVYKKSDEGLKQESLERDRQMLADYPMVVDQFALFYSVGMTTKGIFLKLCKDYERKKEKEKGKKERYVYEEMLKVRKKLEEGIGEIAAYESFAKRCGLQKYRQLVNLLEQAVLKGKSDIGDLLFDERRKSFIERKNHAKELSEEAGTKLLLPMFLMLLVVIVIIMVPAFMNFQV